MLRNPATTESALGLEPSQKCFGLGTLFIGGGGGVGYNKQNAMFMNIGIRFVLEGLAR